jgi:hypothetical protein
MANKRTLGGMDCPSRCAVFADECRKCKHHALYINDQRVYDGCKCLKPEWVKGQAIVVLTSDVVDALGVQWDDPKVQGTATSDRPE